jgi:hypothetical protein
MLLMNLESTPEDNSAPTPQEVEHTRSSESPVSNEPVTELASKAGDDRVADATFARKPREWAALPHPLALVLTLASVLTGIASSFTAWSNYQETRRNNRQPPEPTITAFLVRPPMGNDVGEFEVVVRNDGKTPARSLRCKRALGIAMRPSYNRSFTDPDRLNALSAAAFNGEREPMLQSLSAIADKQFGYHDHAAIVDFLGPGQTATIRIEGNYLAEAFSTAISKEKGYLVIGLSVSYVTPDGKGDVRSFCFERRPPFTAPAQKESLPQCTEGFTFLFSPI